MLVRRRGVRLRRDRLIEVAASSLRGPPQRGPVSASRACRESSRMIRRSPMTRGAPLLSLTLALACEAAAQEQAALDAGWEYGHADAGLYKLTKVWVEGMFLVEVMTRSQAAEYQSIFGIEGTETLEAKLNALEVAYAFASAGQRS